MGNIRGSKLFREAVRILDRKISVLEAALFSSLGITPAQCRALNEIGRAESISLSELAAVLGLDASTMSRTVECLVSAGLTLREPDPEDRRYLIISLSESGKKLFSDIEESMDAHFDDIFVQIPEEKRKDVLENLILIIESVDKSARI